MSSITPSHDDGRFRGEHYPAPAGSPELVVYDPYTQPGWKSDEFDLRRIWQILSRYRWLILSVVSVSMITTMIVALFMRPVYSATSVIELTPNQGVIDFGNLQRAKVDARGYQNTQINILESDSLARAVIGKLDLADDPEFNGEMETDGLSMAVDDLKRGLKVGISMVWAAMGGEPLFQSDGSADDPDESPEMADAARMRALIDRYQSKLTVTGVGDSNLVKISFESYSPEKAAELANAHTRAYIQSSDDRRFNSTSSAKTYLAKQIKQAQSNLEASEKKLYQFARKNKVVDVEDRSNVVEGRLDDLSKALTEVRQNRISAEAEYKQAQGGDLDSLPAVLNDPLVSRLQDQYAGLRAQYEEMSAVFTDAYPKMKQLKSKMKDLKSALHEEGEKIVSGMKSKVQQLSAQEDALAGQVKAERSKLLNLKERAISYNILKREWEANRELYSGLLDKQKDFSVASGMEMNNSSVIDKAVVPSEKDGPKNVRNVSMAGAFGLMGGIGLAFLLAFLDDTFKSREDLERALDIPFLGIMPKIKAAPANVPVPLFSGYQPGSAFAEASRAIRTNVIYSRPGNPPKKLLVTSTTSGEGKSTTAVNLALVMAQSSHRVLIIDVDLRKPTIGKWLDGQAVFGLSEFLQGKEVSIVRPTSFKNLYCIPAGKPCANPSDLLGSVRMSKYLDKLAEHFDFVILDGPPSLGLADPMILAARVDGVLMVVKAGSTGRDAVEETVKRMRAINAPLVGSILNDVDFAQPEYGYLKTQYQGLGDVEAGKEMRL